MKINVICQCARRCCFRLSGVLLFHDFRHGKTISHHTQNTQKSHCGKSGHHYVTSSTFSVTIVQKQRNMSFLSLKIFNIYFCMFFLFVEIFNLSSVYRIESETFTCFGTSENVPGYVLCTSSFQLYI